MSMGTPSAKQKIRVALMGCGVVAEKSHLPVLRGRDDYDVVALIDPNLERARDLGKKMHVTMVARKVEELEGEFDLGVVTSPSATHFDVAKQLLESGKHVLVEKPLATQSQQAHELVRLADQSSRVLAVGLVRRYSKAFRRLASIVHSDLLGEISAYRVAEGSIFSWPVHSPAFYDAEIGGGGVLVDHGAHLLDACLWWFGDVASVVYADDSAGGVEADCHLDLQMRSGARGSVTMSRLRQLSGTIEIKAEKANLSMVLSTGELTLTPKVGDREALPLAAPNQLDLTTDLFDTQYANLAKTINGSTSTLVTGRDCLGSIQLIETCYAQQGQHDYVCWQ